MSESTQQYAPGTHPSLPPPPGMTGPWHWIRENLFSGPVDTVRDSLRKILRRERSTIGGQHRQRLPRPGQ